VWELFAPASLVVVVVAADQIINRLHHKQQAVFELSGVQPNLLNRIRKLNLLECRGNYTVPKTSPFLFFWNNSVKNKAISIIFGTQTPDETLH